MHLYDFSTLFDSATATPPFSEKSQLPAHMQGLISEITYHEDSPLVTHCILLPLLQQLGHQSRWLLWLTPQKKLSRDWLQTTGLPLNKVMQSHHFTAACTIGAMEKALKTGNYSVVIIWRDKDLSDEEYHRLSIAAESGNALGFIMRPQHISDARPLSGIKIHSILYH